MTTGRIRSPIERNMAMELVRVTEAAAIAAARHMGKGDKELVDQAAVDAMRFTLGSISMDGVVVIGEGEKDEAPMLYVGELIGDGHDPKVDIAVDPIDGTTLLSKGLPGAIAAIALSARGTMKVPFQFAYMDKIAVGKAAKDVIDINAPVETNLRNIAQAMGRRVEELTVEVLDRPRHAQLLVEIRSAGARVKLISDGDVAAGIHAALPIQASTCSWALAGPPKACSPLRPSGASTGQSIARPGPGTRTNGKLAWKPALTSRRSIRPRTWWGARTCSSRPPAQAPGSYCEASASLQTPFRPNRW